MPTVRIRLTGSDTLLTASDDVRITVRSAPGEGTTATAWLPAQRVVQGFALYYIRFSTWKGQRMYLEDFYVAEEHRSKGLG